MTVRKFRLDSSDTDSQLVNMFFSFVSDNKDYEVEFLRCHNILLTTVPTQVLATAMCRVVELHLHGDVQLSKRQSDYMFKAISESTDLKLRKLELVDDVISQNLDAEIFAMALVNIEEVTLDAVELSEDYSQSVLKAINNKSVLKLKKLFLFNCPLLSEMRDAETMSKALCRVQHVCIQECRLSTNQLTTLFTNISKASMLQLHTLVILEGINESIRGVTPSILARAVCRLNRCGLIGLETMSTIQLEKLCMEIVDCKNLSLTQLILETMRCEMEEVRGDILASAISRLEVVELGESYTYDQLQAIANRVVGCSDSKLRELYIRPPSIVDGTEVDPALLKNMREKLKVYTDKWLVFI